MMECYADNSVDVCCEMILKLYEFKNVVIMEDNNKEHVNHPSHYTSHPSGIECIEVTRHFCFDIGNAIKYLWRAGLKKEQGMSNLDKEIEDCNKAIWYIKDHVNMLNKKLNETN